MKNLRGPASQVAGLVAPYRESHVGWTRDESMPAPQWGSCPRHAQLKRHPSACLLDALDDSDRMLQTLKCDDPSEMARGCLQSLAPSFMFLVTVLRLSESAFW